MTEQLDLLPTTTSHVTPTLLMLEPCEGAGPGPRPGLRPGPEPEETAPEGEMGRPTCEEDEQDPAQTKSDVMDRMYGYDGLEEDEDEAVSFSFC